MTEELTIGVKGRRPSKSQTCEEASPMSRRTYIPCGKPATAQVHHKRDDRTLAMCAACADHNVTNRGAEYLKREVPYAMWKRRDGAIMRIVDMDDHHLYSAIKMLERKADAQATEEAHQAPTDWDGAEYFRAPEDILQSRKDYGIMLTVAAARGIDVTQEARYANAQD